MSQIKHLIILNAMIIPAIIHGSLPSFLWDIKFSPSITFDEEFAKKVEEENIFEFPPQKLLEL